VTRSRKLEGIKNFGFGYRTDDDFPGNANSDIVLIREALRDIGRYIRDNKIYNPRIVSLDLFTDGDKRKLLIRISDA
jgi:hypothetical protein